MGKEYRGDAMPQGVALGAGGGEGHFVNHITMFVKTEFLIVGLIAFRTLERRIVRVGSLNMLPDITLPIRRFVCTGGAVFINMGAFDGVLLFFATTVMEG